MWSNERFPHGSNSYAAGSFAAVVDWVIFRFHHGVPIGTVVFDVEYPKASITPMEEFMAAPHVLTEMLAFPLAYAFLYAFLSFFTTFLLYF